MPVVDQHDDLCESFIAAVDPTAVSEILKVSSWRESDALLDRDFALIVVDDLGKEHRKFACFDAGNALMSEWYLLNAEHGLPEHAVKVAAANIADSLDSFGLVPTPATVFLADSHAGADERRVFASSSSLPREGDLSVEAPAKVASVFDAISELSRQWDDLDPYDRHEAAVEAVKVASAVGASIPPHIFQYSGTSLSPMFKKVAEARTSFTADQQIQSDYLRLSKMASAMDPEDVVEAMFILDEQAGLYGRYGDRLPDPVLSVYGATKEAEYSWVSGGDYVTEKMLKRYAGSIASTRMEDIFSEDIMEEFRESPIETFKAMPIEQQTLVARLASQSRDTNNGGY